MKISILRIIAIVCFCMSVALAIVDHQIGLPMLWAVWAPGVLYVFGGLIP